MDDRNVNFRNLIHPDGSFTLYHGKKPANVEGEAIEAPSRLVVVRKRAGMIWSVSMLATGSTRVWDWIFMP